MSVFPYVYKLTHKETNEFYIGVRWGNNKAAKDDLGIKYFSSSSLVKPRFHEFDSEIIMEFQDKEQAINYEQQLIEYNWGNPLLLNKAIQVSKTFRCRGHSEETKRKMSKAKKGKPPNNKGTKLSEERKRAISVRSSQYTHTEHSKEKIRQKALGNKRGLGNKSRSGQTQSKEERLKKSLAMLGEKNHFYGKKHNNQTKILMQGKAKNRTKIKCEHCLRDIDPANSVRYHGDKCKLRKNC